VGLGRALDCRSRSYHDPLPEHLACAGFRSRAVRRRQPGDSRHPWPGPQGTRLAACRAHLDC
jgi:hypothetical protein